MIFVFSTSFANFRILSIFAGVYPRFFFFLFFFIFCITAFSEDLTAKKIHLANGFDFPVAPPNADEFYKSRGFRAGGHMGEDWIQEGGSGSSFGKPVYAIGSGIVMLARDVHVAWGNVIVIRHAYLEERKIAFIDSLYAHLDRIHVKEGNMISRGQQIGAIGNNHGMYASHLHFEIHKNLNIGVNHTGFSKNLSNYWVPTDFILKHRSLAKSGRVVTIPSTHFDIPSPNSLKLHCREKKHSKKKKRNYS